MDNKLVAAIHSCPEGAFIVGVFTDYSKAMNACEEYDAGVYGDLIEFKWEFEYDGDEIDMASCCHKEYAHCYECEMQTLDRNVFKGSIAREKGKRKHETLSELHE